MDWREALPIAIERSGVTRYRHLCEGHPSEATRRRYRELVVRIAAGGFPEAPRAAAPSARPRGLGREIVVARHREHLGWLDGASDFVTVYNKGPGPVELRAPHALAWLPNVGREAGTYLAHITRHYDDLAGWTFFVQGDGGVHQPDLLRRIAAPHDGPTCLATRYLEDSPADWIKARDLVGEAGGFETRLGDATIDGHGDGEGRPWFNEAAWPYVFRSPMPRPLWFCYSAQWAVPRESIRARSRAFWRWLAREVEAAPDDGESWTDPPINPWSMEVLWRCLWDPSHEVREPPTPAEDMAAIRRARACRHFRAPESGCGCRFGRCEKYGRATSFPECDRCIRAGRDA